MIDSGFFNPSESYDRTLIAEHIADTTDATIIDAGCGEGSHLSTILSKLNRNVTGVGIDLAKEGILAAAKDHPGNIWSCCRPCQLPV